MVRRQLHTRKRHSSSERDRSENQLALVVQPKQSSAKSQDRDHQQDLDRRSPLAESGSILQRIWDRDHHTGRTGDSLPTSQLAIQGKLLGETSQMMDEQRSQHHSAANALSQAIQAKALIGEQDPRSQQQAGRLTPQQGIQLKRGDIKKGIFSSMWGGIKSGFKSMVDAFRVNPNTPEAHNDASTMSLTSPELQILRVLQHGPTMKWKLADIFEVKEGDRLPQIEIKDPLRYRIFAGFAATEFAQESLLALILLKFLDWGSPEAVMATAELFCDRVTNYHYQSYLEAPNYPVDAMSNAPNPEDVNVDHSTLTKLEDGVREYRAADEELTQAIRNNDGRDAENALNERKLQAWYKVMEGLNASAPQLSHLVYDNFSRFQSADGALEQAMSAIPEFRSVNMRKVREYLALIHRPAGEGSFLGKDTYGFGTKATEDTSHYKLYRPRGVIKSKMKYKTRQAPRRQQWYNDNME
ncbi:hypothetical protein [Roseofilum casamattae]|uniref:Uncharacterized protein n=1 Tax=Roseofilum casamattae BLCC-M143 TaxID=3022442 RepID=A0ABT7BWS9_9CYAN|nr:hypothetical protein [Roseofilum casamattae]MDJ1183648.1 hypothetical protein [Roseofilum casamattae BLCC-M143]